MTFSGNFMPKRFGAGKDKQIGTYTENIRLPKGADAIRVLRDGKWQPKGKK